MKKYFLLPAILLLCLSACKVSMRSTSTTGKGLENFSKSSTPDFRYLETASLNLDSLLINHQYFTLKKLFNQYQEQLPESKRLFLQGYLQAVFNQRLASTISLHQLLSEHEQELSPLERVLVLETAAMNSLFLYNYAGAYAYTLQLLSLQEVVNEKRKEHENNLLIYQALQAVPPQIINGGASQLPILKDQAGLSRIPISINNMEEHVIFDTGANFSVITDSLALKVGLEIIDTSFKVNSITGLKIDSQLGVAEQVIIGNNRLENVIFLVFPEHSLSFPQIDYTIDAILGFPVINALQEIQLIRGTQFRVSRNSTGRNASNMAMDFLTPLIEVVEDGKSLPFTFDTGANTTSLYSEYFKLREQSIRAQGTRDTIMVGGAGGAKEVAIHVYPFSAQIGQATFALDSAAVYQQDLQAAPGIYGNLGQDILGQFDTLSLNFKEMWIDLK